MELLTQAANHGAAVAFHEGERQTTYAQLWQQSQQLSTALLAGEADLSERRVSYLVPPGPDYASTQWGIWRAGGIAVPLSLSATDAELDYTINDSGAEYLVVSGDLAERAKALARRHTLRVLTIGDERIHGESLLPNVAADRRAMILYTSGTTSKPKGVVSTHANIAAQTRTLIDAWQWQSQDRIPLFLPLHHIHAIINVMSCALWAGATIEPFYGFERDRVLERVANHAYTVFMAVPTIYVKLIQHLQSLPDQEREIIVAGFRDMRLMVSGSAALPASVHETWTQLTGQKLLERYGMTEIGMALSNPYIGERRPGAVGQPLPGVDLRLQSDAGDTVTADAEPGEIQVRGPGVFHEYWGRKQATEDAFDDGWFKTGDMAVREAGYYRIMGRQSVDIIKSGGYKLSALEIEAVLLDHPSIEECAVVGVADDTWGEVVAVAIVIVEGHTVDQQILRTWCAERMSNYKIPRRLIVVERLPRNAMGKVTKPAVRDLFLNENPTHEA